MQAKQIDKLQNSIGHYIIYLPAINNLSIIFIAIKPQVAFAKIRFVVCTESINVVGILIAWLICMSKMPPLVEMPTLIAKHGAIEAMFEVNKTY
jgi:hypothetical protein